MATALNPTKDEELLPPDEEMVLSTIVILSPAVNISCLLSIED